jgi:hypothetical protein
MSLSIQPSAPGATQHRPGALPAGASAGGAVAAPASVSGSGDHASFSAIATLLAQLQADPSAPLPTLPAPGSEPARALETLLAQRLGLLLRAAGLPPGPALAFDVMADGRVRVEPNRPDAVPLQRLVDAHADVQGLMRLLHAIHATAEPGEAAATQSVVAESVTNDSTDAAAASSGPRPLHPWHWPGVAPWARAADAPDPRSGRWWLAAAAAVALLLWLL